jgi:hypothetical protein
VLDPPSRKGPDPRLITAGEGRLLALSTSLIITMIFVSTLIQPEPWMQTVALFGHLICLAVGFGSVIAVDWYGLLFLLRLVPMRAVLMQAHRMTPLIWLGLLGLVVTGSILKPELDQSMVLLKMAAVLGTAVIGVLALGVKRQMLRVEPYLPRSLMLRGMVLTAASQSLWWTAIVVGFLTDLSRR